MRVLKFFLKGLICLESICYRCIYYGCDKGCLSGPMEECYPPENWCEAQSENFLTEEGCYRYEEK